MTTKTESVVGVFGIGLAAYWLQFDGLKQRLIGYQEEVELKLMALGARVVSAGLVDTAPAAQIASNVFTRERVDLIVCYVGTYSTSSQVLPVVQRNKAPVLVLNLQPSPTLNYPETDTGEWLANCCACCVPEISNAFARSGITFNVVSGLLFPTSGTANRYYEQAWKEIGEWVRAASVMRHLNSSRVGFLGHTYPGMLDMYSDFTMHHAQLGLHVEILEIDDLQRCVDKATNAEIDAKVSEIKRTFEILGSGTESDAKLARSDALVWAARVACGLDRLATDHSLNGLAYYYRGLDGNQNELLGASLIVGNSLLTARGIPAAGEGDLKTCIAMMIMDRLNAGGSFTEFYAMDFNEDFVLMGHDGPGHVAISDGVPVLRELDVYHGKRGNGLSVEFKVKYGPITILGLTQTSEGRLKLLVAEGESKPGPTLKIGNTNSRISFSLDPAEFLNRWSEAGATHHCALGLGQHSGSIKKLARLLNLELVVIGK